MELYGHINLRGVYTCEAMRIADKSAADKWVHANAIRQFTFPGRGI